MFWRKRAILDVTAGQAVITRLGGWARYSTPENDGAEYVAICLPDFSPESFTETFNASMQRSPPPSGLAF